MTNYIFHAIVSPSATPRCTATSRSCASAHLLTTTITNKRTTDTPSPPTKSFPAKSPWVKLSGRPAIKLYGHENSHPLELRVCLSQTL